MYISIYVKRSFVKKLWEKKEGEKLLPRIEDTGVKVDWCFYIGFKSGVALMCNTGMRVFSYPLWEFIYHF